MSPAVTIDSLASPRKYAEIGLLHRDGAVRRNQPFRYWLPAPEDLWQHDVAALLD